MPEQQILRDKRLNASGFDESDDTAQQVAKQQQEMFHASGGWARGCSRQARTDSQRQFATHRIAPLLTVNQYACGGSGFASGNFVR